MIISCLVDTDECSVEDIDEMIGNLELALERLRIERINKVMPIHRDNYVHKAKYSMSVMKQADEIDKKWRTNHEETTC